MKVKKTLNEGVIEFRWKKRLLNNYTIIGKKRLVTEDSFIFVTHSELSKLLIVLRFKLVQSSYVLFFYLNAL